LEEHESPVVKRRVSDEAARARTFEKKFAKAREAWARPLLRREFHSIGGYLGGMTTPLHDHSLGVGGKGGKSKTARVAGKPGR